MVTQVPQGGLTSVEQALVEHVGRGEWLDLIPDVPKGEVIDGAAMRSWGDSRTCRAFVIRDILRGRLAADPDPHGLRLRGARITSRLDLESLTTDVNLELKDCLLEEGVLARGARLASVVLAGCHIEHPAESPLDGADLTCSALDLAEARVIGHSHGGAVHLFNARIGGDLFCMGAELRNDFAPALMANSMQVDGSMSLSGRFNASASASAGAVDLSGARIGGSLRCSGAQLRNDSGPALIATSMQVGQDMVLSGGFSASGSSSDGAVNLTGARIGGQLTTSGAELRNDSGPALSAAHLEVDHNMILGGTFTDTGSASAGAVYLVGARIGGNLTTAAAELHSDSGPALAASVLQVGQSMFLAGRFTGGGEGVAVELAGARVDSMLVFAPARLEHKADSHRLAVDGLTYAGVPQPISADAGVPQPTPAEGWLDLLRDGTPRYAAQPYQQLAAGYRALGDERETRKILIAQREDELARTDPGPWERLWGKITEITLGYGYKPWRALWFLAGVLAVSCVLAVLLGSHGALTTTDKTLYKDRPCTVIQQVSVGLDLNLPVGTSVARVDCDLTKHSASVTAAWLTAVGWILRLLAWAFAALFIAGFTSAVRKT